MLGAALRIPFRWPFGLAGLLSGLEVMSTTSPLPGTAAFLLGKLYMSAVLMLAAESGEVATSVVGMGELSRLVRLLVGDNGAAEAVGGLDWVVKSSLMVLPECFRLSRPGLADIG